MLHINHTTSKVDTIGENPISVKITSGEIDLRCADLGTTPIGWQNIYLWWLTKRSMKTKKSKTLSKKIVVITDITTHFSSLQNRPLT
jgi:hypothetical protein